MTEFSGKYLSESELPAYSGIEVAWGAWQPSGDRPLYTTEINSCIGVAAYDRSQKVGYLAHVLFLIKDGKYDDYSRFGNQDEVLNPMMDAIAADLRSPKDLNIWIAGGNYDSDSFRIMAGAEMRRQRLLAKLAFLDVPESNYHFAWNEEEVDRVDMALDAQTGACAVYFVSRDAFIPGQGNAPSTD
jgi:hypothetical protein